MKKALALVMMFVLTAPLFAGGDKGYPVMYDGGSVSSAKAGTDMKLVFDGNEIHLMKGKEMVAAITANTVTEISYGQDVHRRVGTAVAVGAFTLGLGALTALSKSKKHFIGLTWADGDTKGGFAMQVGKDEYRGVLAGLEGITGKTAVDSESFNVKN